MSDMSRNPVLEYLEVFARAKRAGFISWSSRISVPTGVSGPKLGVCNASVLAQYYRTVFGAAVPLAVNIGVDGSIH